MLRRASTAQCLEYGSHGLAEVIPIEAGFSRRSERMNRRGIGKPPTSTGNGVDPDYNPLDEGNGLFWLDMQDTDSFTQAGTVTQFINKASDVAWEDVNPAAYSATGLNGLPCMDFDGINDHYLSTEAAIVTHFTGGGIAYTIFCVAQHAVADSIERYFGVGNSASANGTRSWGLTTTGSGVYTAATLSDAAGAANVASAGSSDTNPHVFNWWAEDASGFKTSHSLDGAAADPDAADQVPGTITVDRAAVGCRPTQTPAAFFAGNLGELLIYTVALSSAARARVYDYLADKWGL